MFDYTSGDITRYSSRPFFIMDFLNFNV